MIMKNGLPLLVIPLLWSCTSGPVTTGAMPLKPIVVTEPLFYGGEQTVSRLVYGDIRPRELPAPVVEWREP